MADITATPYELDVVGVRLVRETSIYSAEPVHSPNDAVAAVAGTLAELDREIFCVINLRTDGTVINVNIVSMGSLNMSLVSPREVFKSSILSNAASIIALHNHPSGSYVPSGEDVAVTRQLQECGKLLGIELLDHIIVGAYNGKTYSMKEHGHMSTSRKEAIYA